MDSALWNFGICGEINIIISRSSAKPLMFDNTRENVKKFMEFL